MTGDTTYVPCNIVGKRRTGWFIFGKFYLVLSLPSFIVAEGDGKVEFQTSCDDFYSTEIGQTVTLLIEKTPGDKYRIATVRD